MAISSLQNSTPFSAYGNEIFFPVRVCTNIRSQCGVAGVVVHANKLVLERHHQGPDFDDMSSFLPCEINDAIQYINLGYGAQAPKIVSV